MRWIVVAAYTAALCISTSSLAADSALPTEQQFTVAEGAREARRFEMTASGTLVVEPDGRVTEVALDMPASTRKLYREAMLRWTFRPVEIDGRVVRAKVHFLLAATGESVPGSGDVRLGIDHVWFIDPPSTADASGEREPVNDMKPPHYPMRPAREGFGAQVDVLVRLDAQGRVVDAGVDRLFLGATQIRQPGRAAAFAKQFASASLRAAKDWIIRDPEVLAAGSAIVPVRYTPPQRSPEGWQPLIPVEVSQMPWMAVLRRDAVTMTAAGQSSSMRFQLLDDVAGTTLN